MTVIDEFTRECLAMVVDRRIRSNDVIHCLADLFLEHGIPDHLRSDNGPEFTSKAVRKWLDRIGVKTLFIEPGSPWENGYIESFNGKLGVEKLNGEIFFTLREAQVLIERWRVEYNTFGRIVRCRTDRRLPRQSRGRPLDGMESLPQCLIQSRL